jgi:hypothetical protein
VGYEGDKRGASLLSPAVSSVLLSEFGLGRFTDYWINPYPQPLVVKICVNLRIQLEKYGLLFITVP